MQVVRLVAIIVLGMIVYYALGPVQSIAILCLLFILFIFLSAILVSDNRMAAKTQARHDKSIEQKTVELTNKHIDVLVRNRITMVSTDAYGVVNEGKWQLECDYFFNNVVSKVFDDDELNRYNHYDDENIVDMTTIIDTIVAAKQKEVEHKMEFNDDMDPYQYEQFCALLARNCGWDANATSGSGDQGVDVVARKAGQTLVIQCKKYRKPVGNKAVQEIIAAREYTRADIAAVVTNNTYTKSAKALAQASQVHLLHHVDLLKLDKNLGLEENHA